MALLGLIYMRDCWNLGGVLTSVFFFFFFFPLENFWKYIFSSSVNSTNFDEVLEKIAKLLIGKKPKKKFDYNI
jgi:hypothetical protein